MVQSVFCLSALVGLLRLLWKMINSRERLEGKYKQCRPVEDVHLTADLCGVQVGTLEVSCCLLLLPLNSFQVRQQQHNLDYLYKPTSVWCTHTLVCTLTHTNTLAVCVASSARLLIGRSSRLPSRLPPSGALGRWSAGGDFCQESAPNLSQIKRGEKREKSSVFNGCACTLNHSVQALKGLSAFNVHLVSAYWEDNETSLGRAV